MNKVTVSVVIPAYNRLAYIDQALESVFVQNHPRLNRIECVVVDDGSSDGTYERLEKYHAEGKITLLSHPGRANKGQSAALNLGLENTNGDFICILDSDDYFCGDKFSTQIEYLLSNPEVGMVYGFGHAVSANGDYLFDTLPKNHQEDGDPNNILLNCYIAVPGGAMIRKEVMDQVGGFEEAFRASQDHDMAIRLFEACKVSYLAEAAFCYRKHEDAISKTGLERRWLAGFEILDRAGKRWEYRPATIRKRRAVLNYHLGKTYCLKGRYIAALICWFKCGIGDPARVVRVLTGNNS